MLNLLFYTGWLAVLGARSNTFVDGGAADVHVGGNGRAFSVGWDMDKHSLSHRSCWRWRMSMHAVLEETDRHIRWWRSGASLCWGMRRWAVEHRGRWMKYRRYRSCQNCVEWSCSNYLPSHHSRRHTLMRIASPHSLPYKSQSIGMHDWKRAAQCWSSMIGWEPFFMERWKGAA